MKIGLNLIEFDYFISKKVEFFWQKHYLKIEPRTVIRFTIGLGFIALNFQITTNFYKDNPFYNEDGTWKKEAKP